MTATLPAPLERAIQADVMACYHEFDCQVIRFAEGRRSRITPGWPDLAVFVPSKRLMFLHEVKRPGGTQSVGQSTMQQLAESCGIVYVIGGVESALTHLRALGLVR